jgi:recombinational DNA repair protein (RecF pathway)
LAGRLEFGNEVQLGMHRGRNLDVVVSADIIEAHWQRLVQPERFAAASIIVELIDAFCEPDLAQPAIYTLLTAGLRAVGHSEDPLALLPRFSIRLLDALGLAPPVETCVHCGRDFSAEKAWLDAEQGGFACEGCRANWRDMLMLEQEDVRNLRAVAAAPGGAVAPALRATQTVAQAIEALVNHHLGRRPKAGVHALEFVRGA